MAITKVLQTGAVVREGMDPARDVQSRTRVRIYQSGRKGLDWNSWGWVSGVDDDRSTFAS